MCVGEEVTFPVEGTSGQEQFQRITVNGREGGFTDTLGKPSVITTRGLSKLLPLHRALLELQACLVPAAPQEAR